MSKGKVLVIDDEDRVLTICHQSLTSEGYEVKTANNGRDGLKLLENEPFDVVLVDVRMSDINGIKVLGKIKGEWPETQVIIITGYGDIPTTVSATKLGAFDYIEKPFTLDKLSQSVQRALDKKNRAKRSKERKLEHPKVLVIDDEDIVLKSCLRALTPEGYEVKTATNGRDGLKLLENEPFDIVLVDIKMPDMDGIEVLRRIKGEWPETQVIIITGYSTISTAISSIKIGAYDYIEKPFTPDGILSAVKKALAQEEQGKKNNRNI